MAVVAVLNTLVQMDTTAFDAGADRTSKRAGKLGTDIQKGIGNGVNQTFSGFNNLSGLDGMFGGVISRTMSFSRTFIGIISNTQQSASSLLGGVGKASGAGVGSASGMLGMLASPIGLIAGAAIAGTAAVVGFGVALNVMANHGSASILQLRSLSQEIGFTVEQMSRLSAIPDFDRFGHAMIHMQRSAEEMSAGFSQALGKLKIDPGQFKNMGAEEQLNAIASAFPSLATQGEKAAVAMAAFGRGGISMIEMLNKGSAGLDDMRARAVRFGLDVTTSQANAVKSASKAWSEFGLGFEGVGQQAAILLAPAWEAIGKAGGNIAEWMVKAFKAAAPYFQQFGEYLAKAFAPAWEAVKNYSSTVGEIFIAAFPLFETLGELVMEIGRAVMSVFGGGLIAMWQDAGGGIVATWKAILPWIKIGVEYVTAMITAFTDVVQLIWDGVWEGIKLVGRSFAETFNILGITTWFDSMSSGWTDFKTVMLTTMAATVVAMRNVPSVWRYAMLEMRLATMEMFASLPAVMRPEGITDSLAQARSAMTSIRSMGAQLFAMETQSLVSRWQTELAGGLRQVGQAAAASIERSTTPLSGMIKALTDADVALAGGGKAFSLEYGTQGTMEMYQRATANGVERAAERLRQIQQQLARSAFIRRARL